MVRECLDWLAPCVFLHSEGSKPTQARTRQHIPHYVVTSASRIKFCRCSLQLKWMFLNRTSKYSGLKMEKFIFSAFLLDLLLFPFPSAAIFTQIYLQLCKNKRKNPDPLVRLIAEGENKNGKMNLEWII